MKKTMVVAGLLTSGLIAAPCVADDWQYGIGVGFGATTYDGDMSIGTGVGTGQEVDVDYDVGDIESGFGFQGYVGKNAWRINYSLSHKELSADLGGDTLLAAAGEVDTELQVTTVDINFAHKIAQFDRNVVEGLIGARYLKHDVDMDVESGGLAAADTDENWTDIYVGINHALKINREWAWVNHANIGAGGSDLTYTISTGFAWQFAESWKASVKARYLDIDFEEDSEGDANWYEYDAAEYGAVFGIMYEW